MEKKKQPLASPAPAPSHVVGYHPYNIQLPNWDGPFDLLLDLIRASKIKIQDISICQITKDYLEALTLMKNINMHLTADFIVMASQLIQIKSRILLPDEIDSDQKDLEDPKKDLIEKLLNYEKYKLVANKLEQLSSKKDTFLESVPTKKSRKSIIPKSEESQWEEITLMELMKAFTKILESNKAPPILSDQEFDTKDKIDLIRTQLKKEEKIKFDTLFANKPLKQEIVITLSAVLEMYKFSEINILQNKAFGEIFLFLANHSG